MDVKRTHELIQSKQEQKDKITVKNYDDMVFVLNGRKTII